MNPTVLNRSNPNCQNKVSVSESIYRRFYRLFQSYNNFCTYVDECLENLCKGRRLKSIVITGSSSDIFDALEYATFTLELEPDSIYAVQDILAKGIDWLIDVIISERFCVITSNNIDEIYRLPESFLQKCTVFNLCGNLSSITLAPFAVMGEALNEKVVFFDDVTSYLWTPSGEKERLEPAKGKVITAMLESLKGNRSYIRKEELVFILYKTVVAPYQKMQKQNNRLKVAISTINAVSMRLTGSKIIVPDGKNLLKFAQKIDIKTF